MRDYASLSSLLHEELGLAEAPDYPIYSDMDIREISARSLASSFYKKLAPNGNSKVADQNALEKFLSVNESIPSCPFEFNADNEVESCFWDYFKDNLRQVFEPHVFGESFDLDFIRETMMVGPGAAQKADSTYMVSKLFESTISYINKDLIRVFRAAVSQTDFWNEAEKLRNQKFGFTAVRGCKIFFAPKNADISRTCGTQPSLEMLFQKAISAFLERRCENFFGISLKSQPDYNRNFARRGSIDGSFGTIDLTSASDYISEQLFRSVVPNCPLKTMMLDTRDKLAVLPDGSEVALKMMSTMGNGFTFAMQTVIFASVVRAVYHVMGFPCVCPRTQFGVFGDDIIVRREAYNFTVKMLHKLGFRVNVGKSFNTGQFRESCGHDYYAGHNVRGVYIRSLETHQEVYSAVNRLTRWSADHGIKITKTIKLLLSWVRFIPVPPSEADDAGVCVPWKLSTSTKVNNSYWFKYRCYVVKRKTMKVAECDDEGVINPFGIAVGYLAGHIRRRETSFNLTRAIKVELNLMEGKPPFDGFFDDTTISLRGRAGERTRYRISSKSLPYWDYLPLTKPADRTILADSEWFDYKKSVSLNRDSHDAWVSVMTDVLSR